MEKIPNYSGFPSWKGTIGLTPTLIRESVEKYFPDVNFPVDDATGKPLPLERSRMGKFAFNLCRLLWEVIFKEFRVEVKSLGLKQIFPGHSEPLGKLGHSDREAIVKEGACVQYLKRPRGNCQGRLCVCEVFK